MLCQAVELAGMSPREAWCVHAFVRMVCVACV